MTSTSINKRLDEVEEPVSEKDKTIHDTIVDLMKKPFNRKKKESVLSEESAHPFRKVSNPQV